MRSQKENSMEKEDEVSLYIKVLRDRRDVDV